MGMTMKLKDLRGAHDQTMRCGIVTALFGTEYRDGKSPTEQFLEWMITEVEMRERSNLMDMLTGD
jgi:hypothetical protein